MHIHWGDSFCICRSTQADDSLHLISEARSRQGLKGIFREAVITLRIQALASYEMPPNPSPSCRHSMQQLCPRPYWASERVQADWGPLQLLQALSAAVIVTEQLQRRTGSMKPWPQYRRQSFFLQGFQAPTNRLQDIVTFDVLRANGSIVGCAWIGC